MKIWLRVAAFVVAFATCAAAEAQEVVAGRFVSFASVSFTGGRGAQQKAITLFRAGYSSDVVWVRHVSSENSLPQWASSETCPAVLEAIRALAEINQSEFVLSFALEARSDEVIVVTADGPDVTVWAQGWIRGQYLSPAEIQLRGGAGLPQAEWLRATEQRLGQCWNNHGPE